MLFFLQGIISQMRNPLAGRFQIKVNNTCVKQPLSKDKKTVLQDLISPNAGQKYCRILQGEHSAILSTFIKKLPFVFKTFVLSIFEWPFYKGFTVTIKSLKILPSGHFLGKTKSLLYCTVMFGLNHHYPL